MILLFDGLKRAYDCRTQNENDDDNEGEEDCDGMYRTAWGRLFTIECLCLY